MPQLSRVPLTIKSHPYWIQYKNNRPVAFFGPKGVLAGDISGTKVWDYHLSEFVPIDGLTDTSNNNVAVAG
jgi:hypothetical protein